VLFRSDRCLERDREARRRRERAKSVARRLATLSAREREVFDLVVEGKLNKQIADRLDISIKTVEVHRSRVMEKMEVTTVADLVRLRLDLEPAG
jgi:RNA polymerase sigma factor (sigma-70 family)